VPVNLIIVPGFASALSRDVIDSKIVPKLVLIWVLMIVIVAFKVCNMIKRIFFYNYF